MSADAGGIPIAVTVNGSPARHTVEQQLTDRDRGLLRHIARHRFLSSAQLIALDGGNASNVLARLRALYDHGYLDRPAAQLVPETSWNYEAGLHLRSSRFDFDIEAESSSQTISMRREQTLSLAQTVLMLGYGTLVAANLVRRLKPSAAINAPRSWRNIMGRMPSWATASIRFVLPAPFGPSRP